MALKDHILKLADGVSKCQENAKSLAQVIFRGLDDIADNLPEHPGGGSDVSVTQVLSSGTKTATITVDDVDTDLYAPDPTDVGVTQVQTSGTKIATISVDNVPTDLYAPTPAQPTDVDVTQVVSTGTKIATITVDNVPTDIYAPAGGASQDYSTTERIVGKWIDGTTDVYEKVFTLNTFTIPASGVDYWNLLTGVSELIYFFGTFDTSYGQKIAMNTTVFDDSNTTDSIKSYVAVYPNSNDTLAVKFTQRGSGSGMALTNLHAVVRYTKVSI